MQDKPFVKADFVNQNEVRWCPGCGDYAILSALQRMLPELGLAPEKHVFISGIGCAGRLPYYMNTYGFHTIHGRALAVATGFKAMRDDLSVWVVTGDGDALSIGGNHFIHCLRRNLDINILLLNNQVYGLTKGQFSPTSRVGQVTKTSPLGVESSPINPLALSLASGASFVARAVDKDPKHLVEILKAAHAHKGCSLVEIYQDCHVFNAGAFDDFSTKPNRSENTIQLQHGDPMLFGKDNCKALVLADEKLTVSASENCNAYRHDQHDKNAALRLANINAPSFPVPLGIYYQEKRPVFSLAGACNKTSENISEEFKSKASWRQK